MAKCDLCLQDCNAKDMQQVLTQYRVGGVVDVCPSCRKELDKHKSYLLDGIKQNMKSFILERKQSHCGKKASFWTKLKKLFQ